MDAFPWSVSFACTKPCSLTLAPGGVFSEHLSSLAKLRQSAAAERQTCVLGVFMKLSIYRFPS